MISDRGESDGGGVGDLVTSLKSSTSSLIEKFGLVGSSGGGGGGLSDYYGGPSSDYSNGPGLTSGGISVDSNDNNNFNYTSLFSSSAATSVATLVSSSLSYSGSPSSGSGSGSSINPTSLIGLGLNCAKEFVEGCLLRSAGASVGLGGSSLLPSSSSSSATMTSGIVPSSVTTFDNGLLLGSTTQGSGDLGGGDVDLGGDGFGDGATGSLTSWILVILMTFLIVLTIVGNVLVCLSVILVRKLRKPQNYLLVSLATSDLFVALFVMPLASISEFHESRWPLNSALCDLWVSADVLCCTASILNLCAISLDRHSAITAPFDYSARSTPRRMLAVIFIVWLVSACVSLPPVLLFKNEHFDNGIHICRVSQNKWYQIYATMASFYVPLVVMVVVYVKILRVVADKKKEMTWKKQSSIVQASPSPQQQHHQNQQTSIAMTMTNSSSGSSPLKSQNIIQPSSRDSNASTTTSTTTGSNVVTTTTTTTTTLCSINKLPGHPARTTKLSHKSNNSSNNPVLPPPPPCPSITAPPSTFALLKKKSSAASTASEMTSLGGFGGGGGGGGGSNVNSNGASSYLLPPVTLHRVKKEKLFSGLKEHKASTTLGIIMSAFIICWLPFFVLALVQPIFPVEIPGWVSSLFNWLGYANSALNPVIYATLNRDFRRPFKEILCFRCATLDSLMRKEFYLQQFGDPV